MANLVTINHVSKSYGQMPVLNDVCLDIESGRIIGLLGPNGCGKTTLMKTMAGIIRDYQGTITIDGNEPGAETKAVVSYLPEKTYLPDWMTPEQAIDYFDDFYADFDKVKAKEMINRFQLNMKQRSKTMSKGMQEKLQLTLVMCRKAQLYLLDEPLGGVDPATRSALLDTILHNYSENATLLISTHLIYDVERIFDSIIMLGYGRVMMNDSVDNIRQETGKSIDEVFREVFRC